MLIFGNQQSRQANNAAAAAAAESLTSNAEKRECILIWIKCCFKVKILSIKITPKRICVITCRNSCLVRIGRLKSGPRRGWQTVSIEIAQQFRIWTRNIFTVRQKLRVSPVAWKLLFRIYLYYISIRIMTKSMFHIAYYMSNSITYCINALWIVRSEIILHCLICYTVLTHDHYWAETFLYYYSIIDFINSKLLS
jgi:hypothetical protein